MAYELPPLPYNYTALEPHIDEQTMHLHHDKHHQAYVNNVNTALQGQSQFENMSVDDLMRNLNSVPDEIRTAVRNNGGGHANHSMFWEIMEPNGGGEPTGALAQAITSASAASIRSKRSSTMRAPGVSALAGLAGRRRRWQAEPSSPPPTRIAR